MKLIQNEMMKIFKKVSTYIMIGIAVIIIIAAGSLMKYAMNGSDEGTNAQWKEQLQTQNATYAQNMKEDPSGEEYYKQQIALNEYHIQHNIEPNEDNAWSFINTMVPVIDFVAILTIIVAAGIVASEFSTGTIKLLLIRPASRVKILLSKYAAVILFSIFMLLLTFVVSLLVGLIFFGTGDVGPYLSYRDGAVVESSQFLHALFAYLLSSIGLFMLTTMAFMISAAFRSSSLAIGISIFLLLMGSTITGFLAMKFEWAKYILFANLNLNSYLDGTPFIEGMTMSFSIIMLVVYFVIFHLIAFLVFTKRDVAA
ncbi:ABC transporter permease [Bacillus sp. 1P06AnD]|uniref:ABC transporter permease n=1 Tax=Bacillus sp. 1P06AnD TaxID=3132208 RepID=UPI0039A12DB3